jgi:SHS2 domain-containing protein
MKPYEIFEHTADAGLRIKGKTLEELYVNAAAGLTAMMTDPEKIFTDPDRLLIGFDLKAQDSGELFLKWMREILFNFSAKRFVLTDFKFEKLNDKELSVRAGAIPFDPSRHEQRSEVKAITYHGFKFEKTPAGWQAEVIVDI